ncbi:MAG: hypothetical protein KAJ29_02865 [Alphaproteobacteria bacterium]|nr:hypothetical protein [Alphaproteobacteria bacterium]
MANFLSKLFDWCTLKKANDAEAHLTCNPKLADVIEKHIENIGLEDTKKTYALQRLVDALRSSFPQNIEKLEIIESGIGIVDNGSQSESFWRNRRSGHELVAASVDAGHQLETKYGIISEQSKNVAGQLMTLVGDQENDKVTGYDKLMALEKALEETPDAFQGSIIETTRKAMDTISDISNREIPSKDNLEAFEDLGSCIKQIVGQKYHETLESEAIIAAAYDIYEDTNLQARLVSLRIGTIPNLLSFHKKTAGEELTEERKNSICAL